MKSALLNVLIATTVACPAIVFADEPNQGLSRAQVRAELVQLEQLGYRGDTETSYPVQIQSAERRAYEASRTNPDMTSFGGAKSGSVGNGIARQYEEKPFYSGGN
jgi:hypothetical protein